MAMTNNLNSSVLPVTEQNSSTPASMRDAFSEWLSDGNIKKFSPQVTIACLDKISEYVKSKKISCSIWEISRLSIFKPVYRKVMDAKLLRIMDRNTYKTFTIVGKLYMKFLKEKPWEKTAREETEPLSSRHGEEEHKNISLSPSKNKDYDTTTNTQSNQVVDFNIKLNLSYTRPISISYFSHAKALLSSWTQLYVEMFAFLYEDYPRLFQEEMCFSKSSGTRLDLGNATSINKMVAPKPIPNTEWYIETNLSATSIIDKIRDLLDLCLVDYENVVIAYQKKTQITHDIISDTEPDKSTPSLQNMMLKSNAEQKAVIEGNINSADKKKIMGIMKSRFKNGFRKSSNIDFERFKIFYTAEYDEEFLHDAEWVNYLLATEALVYDDRAYIYDEDVVTSVFSYLEQMDSPCIFIDAFFNKYSSELYTFNIFSIEMLRAFIEKNYHGVSVKWDYILRQENISPSDLIKEVFAERETWSFDELQERLPWLKIDTIRQTMNGSDYFRVDKGTYIHIDNMDMPDNEGKKIASFVEDKLRERDYVTANELDLSMFENLNPHCSFAAVRDAVFYKFLSDKYEKSGQVITKIGNKLRVLDIMEQYCHEAEMVSFEELNAFEATFDPEGRTHSQCLIAGHNTMIRVSAELFVSESNVNFDTVHIDEAIALYCHGDFMPLRGVTDFSLFTFAGYPWNLYLLESYVRRFSRVFKYDVRAVNSANIGVIVRKSFDYNNYDDILALALAKSLVKLSDKKAVGDYLFDKGYIGWRNLGKNESKIIKRAKALREGGEV